MGNSVKGNSSPFTGFGAWGAPKAGFEKSNRRIRAPKPAIDAPKPAIDAPKPAIDAPKPAIDTPKPAIDVPKPAAVGIARG